LKLDEKKKTNALGAVKTNTPGEKSNYTGAMKTPPVQRHQRKLYRKSERYLFHLLIGVASTGRWAMELFPAVSDVAKTEVFIACFAT
jgi:hypothetical protein